MVVTAQAMVSSALGAQIETRSLSQSISKSAKTTLCLPPPAGPSRKISRPGGRHRSQKRRDAVSGRPGYGAGLRAREVLLLMSLAVERRVKGLCGTSSIWRLGLVPSQALVLRSGASVERRRWQMRRSWHSESGGSEGISFVYSEQAGRGHGPTQNGARPVFRRGRQGGCRRRRRRVGLT